MSRDRQYRRARLEVIPLEDRLLCTAQLVPDALGAPFRAVAKVISWWDVNHNGNKDPGELFGATATMIGPHSALTSAHVVYDPTLGGYATSITLEPGLNGGRPPFGNLHALNWVIASSYLPAEDAGHDLAVVNFAQPVGNRTGWFRVQALRAPTLQHAVLHNIGYPGDTHSGDQQFESTGHTLAVTATRVEYLTSQLPVEHGSSGSPVYVNSASGHTIVGAHSRRIVNGAIGLSARITPTQVRFIDTAEQQTGRGGFTLGAADTLPQHVGVAAWDAVHAELGHG